MAETLRPEVFNITAFEGNVLVEALGLVATLDVEAASSLSDQLLAACGLAWLQQHAAVGQVRDQPAQSSKP
ncbi:MAG: hypothetical protein EOO77_10215 [Oxalobacteraceae bacterium]|nr:MAG: hypothetical protein EOO77_10215 [Oxalobacteraceae bacterium]